MNRRPDARVGLRARDHEPPDPVPGEDLRQVGGLEGIAVDLVHERVAVLPGEFRHQPPALAARGQPVTGVLNPDDGHAHGAGPAGQPADIREHAVPAGRGGQDRVLGVDDEQRGVRPAFQGGHDVVIGTLASVV